MEALSPRSANIQVKPNQFSKANVGVDAGKAEAQRAEKAFKDKEHAPPPPAWVYQPPLKPGRLTEKFRSGKLLGKGGFAVCYEGELDDRKYGQGLQKFAMKIVKARMNQKKTMEKFRTELQIHAKMQHPNIVEFHRAFTYLDCTYVILELCPNASVLEMVKRRRCLTLPEVRRFTVQICGAVKYMHTRNVIHRDLKMGNLFLDKDMNIKLGDFGLAAILVTEEEYQGTYDSTLSRRRTMCGTPNYIAPELLEKGKNGHDHKVDIWAIGVIVFAMLTGCPPFQSTTSNEIYRRVKSVEYKWPETRGCTNDIPDEAKDLVACLLRADAEQRPDPDDVVGHPFFSMHGGNGIPLILESGCRTAKPAWLKAESPRGDVIKKDSQTLPLSTLARQCGVGRLAENQQTFEVVGGNVNLSVYKECLQEEEEKSYPIVPLPKDMVYTPNALSMCNFRAQISDPTPSNLAKLEVKSMKAIENIDLEEDELQTVVPNVRPRGITQSHAATLRAAHLGSLPSRAAGRIPPQFHTVSRGGTVPKRAPTTFSTNTRPSRGQLNEFPSRSASNPVSKILVTSLSEKSAPRITRSKSANIPPIHSVVADLPITTDQVIENMSGDPDKERQHRAIQDKERIATNIQKEILGPAASSGSSVRCSRPIRARQIPNPMGQGRLIGPDEVAECIPGTKPKEVDFNLRKIWESLDSGISNSTNGTNQADSALINAKKRSIGSRPLIVKWVDYSNKFGIGYILANGSVGCLFNANNLVSYTCLVVSDAESHLKKRGSPSYQEKDQVVPKDGAPVEFLEDCGEDGIKRVFVPAANLQVTTNASVVGGTLGPRKTDYDFEKRKRLNVWNKFGRYMTQQLGKDDTDLNLVEEAKSIAGRRSCRRKTAGPFVKFYQRLGNVGVWGFGDGSFQLNFPDHTKLIVSESGSWLDFYFLPIETANVLKKQGHLDADELATRGILSYPTGVMARGLSQDKDFRDIITANDLIEKLNFVKKMVGTWLESGGIGRAGSEKYLKWEGMCEASSLVWVSVGAQGGDHRYHEPGTKN